MSDFLDLQGAKDLNTDAIHLSAVANSVDPATGAPIDAHVNRAGGVDYTLKGFWGALGPVVMPWTSVTGGTLTQPNQAFLHPANGNYYSWGGAYPAGGYVVAPGTDPTVVAGYVPRTDVVLRDELSSNGGAELVNSADGSSIQEFIDSYLVSQIDAPKGASKEEARSMSSGVNWVSTMREADAAATSGAAGFNSAGTFQGDGLSNNFAVWELPSSVNSYVCQARMEWTGSNDNCLIGYNAVLTGSTDATTFISVGFASTGFVFNDKITLDVLVPSASLTTGFYNVTMMYNAGFYFVSIQKEGTTKAKTFIVTKTLSVPSNAQIGCYGTGDVIRDFRFCATTSKNPWAPPFGGSRSMSTPLSIPASNPSGVQISVHLPAGYDPRVTHRLAVYCHGCGGTDKDLWDYDNENSVLSALLDGGYVVMSANYGAASWGNQASVTQNELAIQHIKDRYNVFEKPYLVVQSMGGMVGLNTILVGDVKVAAVAGIYPASNLRWQYDNGFTSAIEAAYGFTGSANFDAATAGFDALNDNTARAFQGLKMKFWHSYADTVVSRAQNTDPLKSKVESGGGLLTVVTSTGEHGDASSFDGPGIVEFFRTV